MAEEASHGEAPSLSTYLHVLRRRKWIIIACAILVPAAALFFSARQTALYQSSAEVFINKENIASALTGIQDTTLFVDEERAAETQANLAAVPEVARSALGIAGESRVYPDDLLAIASVAPKGNSDILEFTVTDPDPERAQRLATAYAVAFTRYREKLDTTSIVKARKEVFDSLKTLEQEGRQDERLYEILTEKQSQLQTLQTLQTNRAYVVRSADAGVQVAPTPKRNAILGLALGLVLGVGLAFAIDALDTRVRNAGEVGERLSLTQLARVPPPPKDFAKNDRLVMLAQPTGTSAEAFRMLRTNLEFARLEGEDVRTILVTSALEQEGKSTTAANLAIAEARAGRRVALVDLDLRRPYVDRFFNLLHAPGLTDVALGKVSLDEALVRVDLALGGTLHGDAYDPSANGQGEHGRLDVLVTGPLPPDPGEFVGTKRLADILTVIHDRYDLVVLDTPPFLLVGDAMTVAPNADGILVVARLGIVTRPVLRELHRTLGSAPIPKLGYVVTGSARGDGYGGKYGYGGYGYGDSYYTRDDERSKQEALRKKARQGEPVA